MERAGTAVIDGANAQGAVVGKFAMNVAMEKAKDAGVGWVVVRNTNHYGIAGYYAMMAAERNMIGRICVIQELGISPGSHWWFRPATSCNSYGRYSDPNPGQFQS